MRVGAIDGIPADVGQGRGVGEPDRAPGDEAERLGAVLVGAVEEQLQAEADPEERPVRRRSTPGSDRRGRAGAAGPSPAPRPRRRARSGRRPAQRLGVANDAAARHRPPRQARAMLTRLPAP